MRDQALDRLAALHGVATTYRDADEIEHTPPQRTIRAVLEAMGVACADRRQVDAALTVAEAAAWQRLVAPTVVVRAGGDRRGGITAPEGAAPAVRVITEDGEAHEATVQPAAAGAERAPVGHTVHVRRAVRIPDAVPLGAHRLEVTAGDRSDTAHLLVVPDRAPLPDRPGWGWQLQLYALRSHTSWGIGDLQDLADLAHHAGAGHGADLLLLNPLHAAMPVLPLQPSPYYPSSRRAWDPLYLRPERCDGWDALPAADRDAFVRRGRALNATSLVDRDATFALKDQVLRRLFALPLPPQRRRALDAFVAAGGQPLADLALAFALARVHGRRVTDWPAPLRDRDPAAVAAAAREHAAEVAYQQWLQWQADEQVAGAHAAARAAGMGLGLVTDLAVGVDAHGADGWTLADDLATGITVGAPADALARQGQDWRLPPLRPDRLAATGYRSLREIVGHNLRHAGGIRIDHVMGLWRLFWIPEDAPPTEGTYVRYDAEAMVGAVLLEAHRTGAVVVGEDLGTVEEGVRATMAERGILGSAVFWFEQPAGAQRPAHAAEYRRLALTSVTTHDLPTVAGWLTGEPHRLSATLGLLAGDPEQDRRQRDAARDALLDLLVTAGLLNPAARTDAASVRDAVHRFVAGTPSLLVAASLADAVGDLRQPNLPGTTDAYPNWRLPIAAPHPDGDDSGGLLPPSRGLPLEEVLAHPGVARLARILAARRG